MLKISDELCFLKRLRCLCKREVKDISFELFDSSFKKCLSRNVTGIGDDSQKLKVLFQEHWVAAQMMA